MEEQEQGYDEALLGLTTCLVVVGLVSLGLSWLVAGGGSMPAPIALLYRIGGESLAVNFFRVLGAVCLVGAGVFFKMSMPKKP